MMHKTRINKPLLLLPLLTVFLSTVPLVHALSIASLTFDKFNGTSTGYMNLDKTYPASWKATIYNSLTYNASSSGKATIKFGNATTGTIRSVQITMYKNNVVDIHYDDGSGGVKIGEGVWAVDKPIYVIMISTGAITVGNSTKDWVKDFGVTPFSVGAVGGSGQAYSTTAGYVTVEVDTYIATQSVGSATAILYQIFPAIVLVATLGGVLAMLKKISK